MDITFLKAFIARQRAAKFAGFSGAAIDILLPLPEGLLNEVVQEKMGSSPGTLQQMQVTCKAHNVLNLDFTVRKWLFTKHFNLDLTVEQSLHFPDAPKLQVWLPSNTVLENLLELVVKMRGAALPHTQITGRLIEVDLAAIIQTKHLGQVAQYIQFAEIKIVPGALLLHGKLGVD